MSQQIAAVGTLVGIALLFRLNWDRSARTSMALWLPVLWLYIAGSRNISEWMQLGQPVVETADRYLEGSPIDRSVLTLLMALGVITLARRSRRARQLLKANTSAVVFFLYCGLSVLWSDYPSVGLKRWFRSLGDVIMVLVILTEPDSLTAIKRLLARVGFVLLPLSVLFIRYYPEIGRAYGVDGSAYWAGVTGNKNGLGMICLIFGLGSVWQVINGCCERKRNRVYRLVAHGIVAAISMWLLWIADSKTSLACFVLAGSLMAAVTVSTVVRRPAVLTPAVVTIVFTSFAVLFLGVGGSVLTTMGRDPTLTGRTDVWKAVLQFAQNPLIGSGYESFWLGEHLHKMYRLTGGINQAHNGYIEIYLNLGWVGLLLLGALIATGYRRILASVYTDTQFGGLRVAYFVVAVIYNFTEGSFKMMSPVWIFFLLVTFSIRRFQSAEGAVFGSARQVLDYRDWWVPRIQSS